jgi:hypothetical protein
MQQYSRRAVKMNGMKKYLGLLVGLSMRSRMLEAVSIRRAGEVYKFWMYL